jgi:hypothetical protein
MGRLSRTGKAFKALVGRKAFKALVGRKAFKALVGRKAFPWLHGKTSKTSALHERLSRGRLPGKVFHGGQRKTLKTSHAAGSMPKTLKTFASESL